MHRKRITLKEIARDAKVSPTTVSLVLNGRTDVHIAQETRDRIVECARKLGYRFKKPITGKLAKPVVIYINTEKGQNHIGTSFFSNLIEDIKRLSQRNFDFIEIICSQADFSGQIKMMIQSDPLLIVSHNFEICRILRDHGIETPIIIPQGDPEYPVGGLTSYFMVDDQQVGYLAARELCRRGARKTLMIFPSWGGRTSRERKESFLLEFESNIRRGDLLNLDSFQPSHLWKQLDQCDLSAYDSFYCYSDAMAIYLIKYLHREGNLDRWAILGTDNLYWGEFVSPSLTTMDLHEENMAQAVIDMAEKLKAGDSFVPTKTRFPVSLIKRES